MTKLAIIADIHGNLTALETALSDAKKQSIRNFICLGDVSNFGPQPRETLERIQELNCPVVMGNADAEMLEPRNLEILDGEQHTFAEIENWCSARLSEANKNFISTFKPTVELELATLNIFAYHGSPKSFNDPIIGTTSDDELKTYFESHDANLYMGGHTHEQFIRRNFTKRVMNPGSVGLPFVRKLGSNAGVNLGLAEYAILEVIQGEANVTFRRVKYDVSRLEQAVRASKMPHGERWLNWL
jgi:putative phosphoesterase